MFLAIHQKLKILWHFEIFVNTGPYTWDWKCQNPTPAVFIRSHLNFMMTLLTMGKTGTWQRFKSFVALETLNMGINGEMSIKMCNILKMAAYRAKWMNI